MLLRPGRSRPAGSDVTVRKRCLGRVDVDVFNETLYHLDWNGVWTCENTSQSWELFCRLFITALDTVAPLTRVRQPPPGAPPLTAATRDLLSCRRRALSDRSDGGRERYRGLNRQCRAAVIADTAAHLERECRNAGPAKMWSVLRPIIGDKKGSHSTVPTGHA